MDEFRLMYKVLKHLKASMSCEEYNAEPISASSLGINERHRESLLIMMQDRGYIRGIVTAQTLADDYRRIVEPCVPEITVEGLEFMESNSLMRKAANLAQGIVSAVK